MLKRERHTYILDRVEKEGRLLTKDLVAELSLAEDTVRKDFQELSAQGKVQRFHGGILKIADKPVVFSERAAVQPTVKQQLAVRAVEFICDKHVLFIDSGTTNLQFAQSIPEDFVGTVFTNAPDIGLALTNHPNAEVIIIGGNLNKTTKAITGATAAEQVRKLNFECCVLEVSSISAENGVTYPLADEANLKREVISRSKTVVAIANKEKLGSVSTFFAADIAELDMLVTNETDEEMIRKYQSFGIEVMSELL